MASAKCGAYVGDPNWSLATHRFRKIASDGMVEPGGAEDVVSRIMSPDRLLPGQICWRHRCTREWGDHIHGMAAKASPVKHVVHRQMEQRDPVCGRGNRQISWPLALIRKASSHRLAAPSTSLKAAALIVKRGP